MTTRSQTLLRLTHSGFRLTVGVCSLLLILWIAMVGVVAVVTDPYLIAAFWILGLAGLMACVGACLNTFPPAGMDESVSHPVRALFCLLGATVVAAALSRAAYPGMGNEPMGMKVAGGALIFGVVVWVILTGLAAGIVILSPAGGKEPAEGRTGHEIPHIELPPQESLA